MTNNFVCAAECSAIRAEAGARYRSAAGPLNLNDHHNFLTLLTIESFQYPRSSSYLSRF